MRGIFSPLKAHVDLDMVSVETTGIIQVLDAAQKGAGCVETLWGDQSTPVLVRNEGKTWLVAGGCSSL